MYQRLAFATIALLLLGCQQPVSDTWDRLVIGEVMMHAEFTPNLRALAQPGGRLAGTPGAARAEEYIADKLRAYGLQNVHFEPFDMQCWIVHETTATLLTDPPRALAGAVALSNTLSTPAEGVTAELLDLTAARTEEAVTARAAELPGRFVLVHDRRLPRSRLLALIGQYGAAGLIVMSPEGRPPIIGNGHDTPQPQPAVVIPHDEDLLALLAAGTPVRLNIRLVTEAWDCRPRNVVGELPGRGPRAHEVVILGAHLDSWHLAEGAMDNGSGSATILETARALAAVGWQPRRTVRFVWFMSEELRLEGSRAYVAAHRDELPNVVAMINLDMPGSPRKFGVFGHHELKPFLEAVVADLRGYELDPEIAEYSGAWSDHAPFVAEGIAALTMACEQGPGVKFYHTAGDTYDTVDRRGTIPSAAVLAVLARRLADAPARPTTFGVTGAVGD